MSALKINMLEINEDDLSAAQLSVPDNADETLKKRVFANLLSARMAMKLLFENRIDVNNLYSMYSIQSLLKQIDIADIYYRNAKLDVRAIFDKELIFIPKSHFELGILPDLYLIFKLDKDLKNFEFLGSISPQRINKENQNDDYYFVEYNELEKDEDLRTQLDRIIANPDIEVSDSEIGYAQGLFASFVDEQITEKDKLSLLRLLFNSKFLREKFVEFENFEMVSSNLAENNFMQIKEMLDKKQYDGDVVSLDDLDFSDFDKAEEKSINEDEDEDVEKFSLENIADTPQEKIQKPEIKPDLIIDDLTSFDDLNNNSDIKITHNSVDKEIEKPIFEEPLEKKKTSTISQIAEKTANMSSTTFTPDNNDGEVLKMLFEAEGNELPPVEESLPPINNDKKIDFQQPEVRKKIMIALIVIVFGGLILGISFYNNQKNKPEDFSSLMNVETTTPENTSDMQAEGLANMPDDISNSNMEPDVSRSVSDALNTEPIVPSISKIAWEVPEDLAYNDLFRKYLQTLGTNLKLSLNNDVLLVPDMVYSAKMVVDIKVSKSGSLEAANIVASSGSKKIDDLVLRNIKNSVNYLKPPASEVNGNTFNATLIINF